MEPDTKLSEVQRLQLALASMAGRIARKMHPHELADLWHGKKWRRAAPGSRPMSFHTIPSRRTHW